MHAIISRIKGFRVIPVVTIERAGDATRLADALIVGGIPCAEITMRTDSAPDAIRAMSQRGDILVGAGTVLTIEHVKQARDAGAEFMVSPGLNIKVADYCIKHDILHTPGICTPSDIEAALDLGIRILKFFPAEAFGGIKTLKAISMPYRDVEFIPTGGITPNNLAGYLRFSKVLACGGSWIADPRLLAEGRFNDILINTSRAANIASECMAPDP